MHLETWMVIGLGLWCLAVLLVLGACRVAARADRRQAAAAPPRPAERTPAEPVSLASRRAHPLRNAVAALCELVDAAHVELTRDPSGEVIVEAGTPQPDPDAPSLVAPLLADGRRVGTLTARRPPGAAPFSPRQFETAHAVAVVLGPTLEPDPGAARPAARSRRGATGRARMRPDLV